MRCILFIFLFMSFVLSSQNCIRVDTVYCTAKLRELGNRDIRFGVKQMAEDLLSEKYCLSNAGDAIQIEIYYFGIPKTTLRIAGYERSNQVTQVGVRFYFKNKKYEGVGESETEVRAVMIELQDGIPFQKTTVSSAIKKAIQECVSLLP